LLGKGKYDLILNTDSETYGSNNAVSIDKDTIDLPPLTTLWFAPRKATKKSQPQKGTKSTKKKTSTKRARE